MQSMAALYLSWGIGKYFLFMWKVVSFLRHVSAADFGRIDQSLNFAIQRGRDLADDGK